MKQKISLCTTNIETKKSYLISVLKKKFKQKFVNITRIKYILTVIIIITCLDMMNTKAIECLLITANCGSVFEDVSE